LDKAELAKANNELNLQVSTCKKELSQAHTLAAERGEALAEVRKKTVAGPEALLVLISHIYANR
jgi:hypothetical protein